jgi:hypothetical protein
MLHRDEISRDWKYVRIPLHRDRPFRSILITHSG